MLKEIYLELQKFELFQKIEQFIQKNKTILGSFIVCVVVSSIGYVFYNYLQDKLNEKSSALFTQAMVNFENKNIDNARSFLQKLTSEGREHYSTFSKIMLTALDQEGKEYKESVKLT